MSQERHSLSAVDTAWLHMDDPTNLMMVTAVALLDGAIDYPRLRATLEARVLRIPRFRMHVVPGRVPGALPSWETDPHFDLDNHLHHLALPAPGDLATLQRFLGDLASTPLDGSKPLWQIHTLENVMGGSAFVMRFHHCLADGVAMMWVLDRLLDPEADAPIDLPEAPRKEASHSLRDTLLQPARSALGLSRRAAETVLHESIESLLHPSHLLELTEPARRSAAILAHTLTMPSDPQTRFKGPLHVPKHVAWSQSVPLETVKTVGRATGAKVNDVLLTAVAGALRQYLLDYGDPVRDVEIRAVVPVNLRREERAMELGNGFGLVFLTLPLGIADPLLRLHTVKANMDALKHSPEAMVFYGLLNIFGATPQQVEDQVVNLFGTKATAVMTNVPGPQQTLYLAGSRVRNGMFWVPQAGRLGMGISIFSYDGKVTLGVITDAGLVPDPEIIVGHFEREFDSLCNALEDAP